MEDRLHTAYMWKMTFDSGRSYTGMAGNTPFDPQNPPPYLGRLVDIELIPRKPLLSPISLPIPMDAVGFHYRDVRCTFTGVTKGVLFCIGYKQGNETTVIKIDAMTGKTTHAKVVE